LQNIVLKYVHKAEELSKKFIAKSFLRQKMRVFVAE